MHGHLPTVYYIQVTTSMQRYPKVLISRGHAILKSQLGALA